MYYPIRSEDVGPNACNHGHSVSYRIATWPGKTNSSHEDRTSGWLGTTNDVSAHALGALETYSEALETIREDLTDGYVLDPDPNDDPEYEYLDFSAYKKATTDDCEVDLFSASDRADAPMYAALMADLNSLYHEHGCPAEQYPEQPGATTGGPYDRLYWDPDDVGEGEGADMLCAEQARQIDVIISTLNLSYPHYYTTPDWDTFSEDAEGRLIEYERSNVAFEIAMDMEWDVEENA